ncbi:MAG TPA: MerR family transcriptional regulator [Burkholderiales bacterium]|nr:MerR family transcriptional regulator [Burkholderiales bacterium]
MSNETAEPRLFKDEKPKAKLVYRMDEVARLAKVDEPTLESWESEFPFLNAGRTGSGQKFFRQRDVDIILRIKELVSAKSHTMAGVRRRIEEEFGLQPSLPLHPDKLRKALYSVREELQQLASSLERLPKKR